MDLVAKTNSYSTYKVPDINTTQSTKSSSSSYVNPFISVVGGIILVFGIFSIVVAILAKIISFINEHVNHTKVTKITASEAETEEEEEEPDEFEDIAEYETPEPIKPTPAPKKIAVKASVEIPVKKVVPTSRSTAKTVEKTPTTDKRIVKRTYTYEICDVRQRSAAWRKLREGRVTGTSAYYLKNHTVDYAIRMAMYDDGRDYGGYWMKRGRELEPIGIAKFAEKYGYDVQSVGFVKSLPYKRAGYSPDGVILGKNGHIKTIIEHKAFGDKHHIACAEKIDDKVMYQIQFGMFVTDASDAYLVLYNPDYYSPSKRLIVKHIEPDDEIMGRFVDCFEKG